jgi:hypothetical protein
VPTQPWQTTKWHGEDTVRVKIVAYLRDQGPSSISGIANSTLYPIASVRDKLNIAQRHGHVTLEIKPLIYPTGQRVIIHQYTITEDGKKWLELAAQE